MGEVRNKVKQSPPVVAFSLKKEQGFEQHRGRRVFFVTDVKGERATFSRSFISAVVKACVDGVM